MAVRLVEIFQPQLSSYLTAPNRAPSHSFFSVSTVLSGKAEPVFLNVSNPASKLMKENFKFRDEGKASRSCRPACLSQSRFCISHLLFALRQVKVCTGITSLPMPSPGISPRKRLEIELPGILVDEAGIDLFSALC